MFYVCNKAAEIDLRSNINVLRIVISNIEVLS